MTNEQLRLILLGYKRLLEAAIEDARRENPELGEPTNTVIGPSKTWPAFYRFGDVRDRIEEDIESLE